MSRALLREVQRLKENFAVQDREYLFYIPTSRADEKKYLKRVDDNAFVTILETYDW